MLVATNDGEVLLLNILLGKTAAPTAYVYRLYKNDVTPTEGSHRADFQEASETGPQSINPADWTVAVDANNVCTATASTRTFTFPAGTGLTVYGYIVTGSDGTNLYWAERFGSPISIPAGGGQLDLTPSLSLE